MPVADLAESDAHLYLWTTNAFMEEAHHLARAWGFSVKTICTWGKVHHCNHLRPSMKTGFYYRGATEHWLFCVRGSLRLNGTWPTLFLWPRIGAHSQKPEAFYDLVEQASPGPYVELFSRRHRMGWDVWGDESANTATLGL
jgi:N6-adenosine-specific RNA methylase IME4